MGKARTVRRRSEPRLAGVGFILVTVLILLGALNSQNNLLYWAFGAAVGALMVSGVVSGMGMSNFRIEALPIAPGDAGGSVRLRYVVRNIGRLVPAFAVTIEEMIPPDDPGPDVRPWGDTMARPVAFVPCVRPGERSVIEVDASASDRGLYRFEGLVVSSSFPFGLFRKVVRVRAPRDAIVRPRRIAPPARLLGAASARMGTSLTRASRIGQHGEFHALRAYAPGDSQRAIAWRASARADELLVRQAAQTSPRRVWIVLAPIEDESLSERAVSLAAGLAEEAYHLGYVVGLSTPDETVRPSPGRAGLARVFDALAIADPMRARPHRAPVRRGPTDEIVFVHAGSRVPSGWAGLEVSEPRGEAA